MEFDLKKTLEALLLSTSEPIALNHLVKLFMRYQQEMTELENPPIAGAEVSRSSFAVDSQQILNALMSLTEEAQVANKAYRVVEVPNGYQLVTAPQFAEFVRLLRGEPRPMKLSPAALETLAIVAYRQPVTRAGIEAIRGVSADSALHRLIDFELVRVSGRAELPGRPLQYVTNQHFLEFIGIKSLADLPASDVLSPHQINDWMRRSQLGGTAVSDIDVGLSQEFKSDESLLDQKFVQVDWQQENAESDAAQ
jgi:segregation and condensation protein B